MAYSKHTPRSRKYRKSESHSHSKVNNSHSEEHNSHSQNNSHIEEQAIPSVEPTNTSKEKKPFSFLSSLFGSNERAQKSGDPLFNILDHDIYLDDLLLVGLILLLLTDKVEDEILLIILVYLLLDIF